MSATVIILPVTRRERPNEAALAPPYADQAQVVEELIPVLRAGTPRFLGEGATREQVDNFFEILEAAARTLRRLADNEGAA